MLELDEFDYTKTTYSINGKNIVIRSSVSPEFIRAALRFDSLIMKAHDSGVVLTEDVDFGGMSVAEPTDAYRKLNTALTKAAIIEWPFDDIDIDDELFENQPLCAVIQNKAKEIGDNFKSKKKD